MNRRVYTLFIHIGGTHYTTMKSPDYHTKVTRPSERFVDGEKLHKYLEDLEYYSNKEVLKTLSVPTSRRIMKAVKYAESAARRNGAVSISSRKYATIRNAIREASTERMIAYNTSPESEAYWSS